MKLEPVQTLWIGPMNNLIFTCLSSFVSQGHPVHLYCYNNVQDIPVGVQMFSAVEIIPEKVLQPNENGEGKGSYAAFSDLFRFSLLYQRGGWWVDADMYCVRPFIAQSLYVFATEHDSIGTCAIHAPAGSSLLKTTIEQINLLPIKNVNWTEYKDIYAENVIQSGLLESIQSDCVFCPISWDKIESYVLESYVPHLKECTIGVHLWNEIWRRNDLYSYVKQYTELLSSR
ncbi:MAG: capsular polysaccharide synthesis protein [Chloroflexales bacterium]